MDVFYIFTSIPTYLLMGKEGKIAQGGFQPLNCIQGVKMGAIKDDFSKSFIFLPSLESQNWNPKFLISDSSVGKESACNVGDPSSIPGSGRSPGEGIDYPFQYSWASLVAQLAKNLPAMWDTWVLSLGWEDPLEKGKATHSSILAWRTPWTI